jgi:hypothetical protein
MAIKGLTEKVTTASKGRNQRLAKKIDSIQKELESKSPFLGNNFF